MRRALVSLLSLAFFALATPAWAAPTPVTTHGYIPMNDGAQLRYTLARPSNHGRYPVVMVYGPYDTGQVLTDYPFIPRLLGKGFALLGLNMRGTGCSSGRFLLLDPKQGTDGAAAVEWIARQPWSNGHVGMAGISYEGISQLLTAGHRPPHLDAIAPGQILSDAYRDISAPGGIMQAAFAAIYPINQAKGTYPSAIQAAGRDPRCAMNLTTHRPFATQMSQALSWPYEDSPGAQWKSWSPDALIQNIDVPVFMTRSWQDPQTGARASYVTDHLKPLWLIESNGDHGDLYRTPFVNTQLERFLEHYLKGSANGWERTPHVRVLHETQGTEPSWVTSHRSTPIAKPLNLYFNKDGRLLRTKPGAGSGSSNYRYPLMSPSAPGTDVGDYEENEHGNPRWDVPSVSGGYVAFTTPALKRDTEILGSGNADLWVSSSAADTDLQITLTEVRPDGQEVYLQRGWLRASHRAEDMRRSTALRPFQTHSVKDAEPLEPGRPTRMRVEIFPIGHVFRAGSAIRIIIDAPTGTTGDWSLQFTPTPATNSIWHDARHPSHVVLPMVSGRARTPLPACDTVASEPCRTSIAPIPGGSLNP